MAVLHQLHLFPLRKRVDFKIATFVYRSLSSMAPAYLAVDCQLSYEEGRRQLRSADSRTCIVKQTYGNFGDWCFTAVRCRHWALGCGTAFQLMLGKRTSATNSLSDCWRLLCLGIQIAVHCALLFTYCVFPNFFTYLLPYLQCLHFTQFMLQMVTVLLSVVYVSEHYFANTHHVQFVLFYSFMLCSLVASVEFSSACENHFRLLHFMVCYLKVTLWYPLSQCAASNKSGISLPCV